jgi:hypothetical protein
MEDMAFMALARTRWFELACDDCDSDGNGVNGNGDSENSDVGGDSNANYHGDYGKVHSEKSEKGRRTKSFWKVLIDSSASS